MSLNHEYMGAPAPHDVTSLLASARQCAEDKLLREGRLPLTCLYQSAADEFVTLTPQLDPNTPLAQLFAAMRGYLLADGATAYSLLGEARVLPTSPTEKDTHALVLVACAHDGALRTVMHALHRHHGHAAIGPAQSQDAPHGLDPRMVHLLGGAPTRSAAAQVAAREQVLQHLAQSPIIRSAWHPRAMPRPC